MAGIAAAVIAGAAAGSSTRQRSCTRGQRVWKRQPERRIDGLGISPASTIFGALALRDRSPDWPTAARACRDARARGRPRASAHLDDLAEIHDRDAVGHAADHVEIVADHQDGEPELLQVGEQVEQVALDRDVEAGGRLVGDQEGGSTTSARAIATRRAWPPLTWCGYLSSSASERPSRAHQVQHLRPALARSRPWMAMRLGEQPARW